MQPVWKSIAQAVLDLLRGTTFSGSRNQRAIAEAIADTIVEKWSSICTGHATQPKSDYGARHMADVSCQLEEKEAWIDIKTRNMTKGLSMPNITAVRRLDKFYGSSANVFMILLIEYQLDADKKVIVQAVELFPVETLDWNCLQIAALGRGQLQIKDAKKIQWDYQQTRQEWLVKFYERLVAFYEREMRKDKHRSQVGPRAFARDVTAEGILLLIRRRQGRWTRTNPPTCSSKSATPAAAATCLPECDVPADDGIPAAARRRLAAAVAGSRRDRSRSAISSISRRGTCRSTRTSIRSAPVR